MLPSFSTFMRGNLFMIIILGSLWYIYHNTNGIRGGRPLKVQLNARIQTTHVYRGPLNVDDAASERAGQLQNTWLSFSEEDRDPEMEPGFLPGYMTESLPYPFQRVVHSRFQGKENNEHADKGFGRNTGIILIMSPFWDTDYYRAEAGRAIFWRLKGNGHIMLGISSYQEFPAKIMNPFDDRHTTLQDVAVYRAMDGWLHCFREPDKMLPAGVPRILLSESDFIDPMLRNGEVSLIPWGLQKRWDIIYRGQGGPWDDFARNWTLAKASFISLITKRNLKVLVVGRDAREDPELQPYIDNGSLEVHPLSIDWPDFLKLVEQSRTLIAPNLHDASPRVLAEALCFNTSILVNRHILGGWKYVGPQTGEFFSTAEDVVDAWDRLVEGSRTSVLRPREWYMENSGVLKSGLLLQAFVEIVAGKERIANAQKIADTYINI